MTAATFVSSIRIALAPLFILLYVLPLRSTIPELPLILALWIILAIAEVSDLVDGRLARRSDQVTDLGKLFDPFADVIARMSYFTCFLLSGIMPLWAFVVIMYREFAVLFLRMRLTRHHVALGAKLLGKAKSFMYFFATLGALAFVSISRLFGPIDGIGGFDWYGALELLVQVLFAVAAILSVASFIDYLRVARSIEHDRSEQDPSQAPPPVG
jgi:CDP-diacylglycerol--glycerol-3-phosphate 3-phosphatidyltransferase